MDNTDLPPGWRLDHDDEGVPQTLVWEERRGPWLLRATCPLWAHYEGPSEVMVTLGGPPSDAPDGGVPVDALRSFPLREIKAQARTIMGRIRLQKVSEEVLGVPLSDLPQRCRTDDDYALWAAAWTLVQRISKTSPVKVLMDHTGMAQSSVSTRLAQLRKRGLIDTGKEGD
ncbi:helix-turn-helix domain-containing protein [Streptomyces sp. NPDC052101]|uniref:helix-turn-helix domain-containing protein n=1 Tax=Streptomyces sp. NPDC052101 TaxID=3155763 RepID=UPI003443DD8C